MKWQKSAILALQLNIFIIILLSLYVYLLYYLKQNTSEYDHMSSLSFMIDAIVQEYVLIISFVQLPQDLIFWGNPTLAFGF